MEEHEVSLRHLLVNGSTLCGSLCSGLADIVSSVAFGIGRIESCALDQRNSAVCLSIKLH